MSVSTVPNTDIMNSTGAPLIGDNFTGNHTREDSRDEQLALIEIAVQATVLVLAVLGNSMVLLSLKMRRKKLSRMHLLIVHLSLADIFVAFFQVLPQMAWDITYRFHGGDFMCRLVKYFQILAMYASSYVLMTTAIDRYFAICHPLTSTKWTSRKVHKMVIAAWLLSLTFSTPQIIIFSYKEVLPGVYDCWGDLDPEWKLSLYITWITLSIYIIPTILLALVYGCICFAVWKSGKMAAKLTPGIIRPLQQNSHVENKWGGGLLRGMSEETILSTQCRTSHPGISRAARKTIKLTIAVVVCYLFCWSPFFVAQMWAAFDKSAPFYGPSYTIILLLASLNSCTNPWIYMAFSKSICDGLKKLFFRRNRTTHRSTDIRPGSCCVCMYVKPQRGVQQSTTWGYSHRQDTFETET